MKDLLKKAEGLGCKIPHKKWRDIDAEVEPVLRSMEKLGIKLDTALIEKLNKKLEKKIANCQKRIYAFVDDEFNISSPSQIADVLFKKLKLPTQDLKRTKTGISTGAAELEKLKDKHPIIECILEYRELSKLLTTYLRPLPELVDKNGRLHTSFGQDTRTSRFTSSNPNLQNIPIKGNFGPEIRKAFIAEKGFKLISADYSQIELRVVACLAGDKSMIEAFRTGVDIHSRTASELFDVPVSKVTYDQRRVAKTVNFGIVYGISPYGLSQTLKIEQSKAAEYIMRYFNKHQGIQKYCEDQIAFAKKNGYVETLFGFRRDLKREINSKFRNVSESAQRMAVNTPVQGTAAEILKLAMVELSKKLPVSSKLILTVHDELIVEAKEKDSKKIAQLMREVMENVVLLSVPVEVEVGIGDNWDEAKHNVIKKSDPAVRGRNGR